MEQVVYIGIMMEKHNFTNQKVQDSSVQREGYITSTKITIVDIRVAQLLNCELIIIEFDV